MKLKDKVTIVTGGARGIGASIARCFAAEGARIAILDIDGEEAEAMAKTLDVEAMGIAADLSSVSQATAAADQVAERLGGIDILINNAGGSGPKVDESMGNPFTNITQDGWDDQITTNLTTTFAATKSAIPHIKKRSKGSIINMASVAALMPVPGIPSYGAAKAAVISLTKSLAIELAPDNINVNAICPGILWTRAWEYLSSQMREANPALADKDLYDIFLMNVKKKHPHGQRTEARGTSADLLFS